MPLIFYKKNVHPNINFRFVQIDFMVGKILTPQTNTVSFSIPNELIGKKVKIIAYSLEDESSVIDNLVMEQIIEEEHISIPEWQQKLVLSEQKFVEENPSSLKSWDAVINDLRK